MVEPIIGAMEDLWISRLGSYQARCVAAGSLEIVHGAKSYKVTGLDETFCDMGMSRHERPTISAILACVSEGMIVWDVGANNGFYTCLLSQIAGAKGGVFAFEPNPDAYAELVRQLSVSDMGNVWSLRTALSDSDGAAQMLVAPNYTQASRIAMTAAESNEKMLTISVQRGDSLIQQGLARHPSFIKLDVEGHELSALHGMQKLLSAPDLRAILCEIHFSASRSNGRQKRVISNPPTAQGFWAGASAVGLEIASACAEAAVIGGKARRGK